MLLIVDYKMGNLGSIVNMIKKIGGQAMISSDKNEIAKAEKLILPGVGAFDAGMETLKKMDLIGLLGEKVLVDKTPILGICLGMQLLTNSSEEGILPGLKFIDAETVKFKADASIEAADRLKVPHMGWNNVVLKKESALFKDMHEEPRFYFVHSYYVACKHPEDVLTVTDYGVQFASSVERENVYGVQFHPEKSHKYGMKLLENFLKL